jgi:2-aminoadipate transaminase
MVVEALPELAKKAGRSPAVIYVIPNFQNPSGVTMSQARRRMLLELAARWGSIIIDDDPYGMLRFSGTDVPGLQELSGNDPRVVSVRTFSKIIAPGLRVGWVQADPRLIVSMVAAKQAMDTCTNLPAQRIVAGLLSGGHLRGHLERVRAEYRHRKQGMDTALRRWVGTIASWTDPEGGFFVWVRLPEDVDCERLFEVALAEGVAFIPGPAFSASGGLRNALRLCFASNGPERTDEGVARLAAAIAAVRGRTAQRA